MRPLSISLIALVAILVIAGVVHSVVAQSRRHAAPPDTAIHVPPGSGLSAMHDEPVY